VRADIDREALLQFLGFGNPAADVVFIGMEEGLSVPPPLEDQLAERSLFPPLIDLAESARVHAGRFFASNDPPIQSTWNVMIRILLALDGCSSATTQQVRRYQRDRLGRTSERAALIEMLPLPAPSLGQWPYDTIFPDFPSRESYRIDQLPKRIDLIKRHLAYGPKLVVAYGSAYWPNYKALFPGVGQWQSAAPFQVGRGQHSTVILTPHFTARQMNGKRDNLIRLSLEAMDSAASTSSQMPS
jgi:hypothetical protein